MRIDYSVETQFPWLMSTQEFPEDKEFHFLHYSSLIKSYLLCFKLVSIIILLFKLHYKSPDNIIP